MERSGLAPLALVGFGAFLLGAMMFGGAATTAGAAATAGAVVLWPLFALFKLVFFFLLLGFVARMFWGRGPGGRMHRYGGERFRGSSGPHGRSGWPGPWAPPWAAQGRDDQREDADDGRDPRAWFEERVEDWHLKAHARMDIDREVPDPTRDEPDDRTVV